jgi:hypothetical protein
MTTNQSFLHMVDSRLVGLKFNHLRPNENLDTERARMEAARTDVLSRMDQAERDQYVKLKTTELTPAEKRAQAEAERLAMEANRDKPSI